MKKYIVILFIAVLLMGANLPLESSYYNAYKWKSPGLQIFTSLTVADFDEVVNGVVVFTGDSFLPIDPDQLLNLSGRCWLKFAPSGEFILKIEKYINGQLTPALEDNILVTRDRSVSFNYPAFRGADRFVLSYQLPGNVNEMKCRLLIEPVL